MVKKMRVDEFLDAADGLILSSQEILIKIILKEPYKSPLAPFAPW